MDFSQFSIEDLRELKAKLDAMGSVVSADGRSPIRPRQLHDLRLLPTATDPRPTFFWSSEAPRNEVFAPPPFRQLVWQETTGTEKTVTSKAELEHALSHGWTSTPPSVAPMDPEEELAQLIAALSPEDQRLLIEAQKQERMAKLKARVGDLTPEALEAFVERANTSSEKRRPGRPRKADVA